MKTWAVIIIFLSCAGLVGATITDWYKDNIINNLKAQAVDRGYAEVTVINNKLKWHWKDSIWEEETINDQGEDIEIKSR